MIECPLCQSTEVEEIERDEIDDSLECMMIHVKYECECGNEFDVAASFPSPFIVYC